MPILMFISILSYTDKLLVFRWILIVLPLDPNMFLFCYERDFMTSLFDVKQAEIIEAFKSTSRYLDDLLNIDNPSLKAWSIVFIRLNCS